MNIQATDAAAYEFYRKRALGDLYSSVAHKPFTFGDASLPEQLCSASLDRMSAQIRCQNPGGVDSILILPANFRTGWSVAGNEDGRVAALIVLQPPQVRKLRRSIRQVSPEERFLKRCLKPGGRIGVSISDNPAPGGVVLESAFEFYSPAK